MRDSAGREKRTMDGTDCGRGTARRSESESHPANCGGNDLDLERCFAYGDSASDRWMLEAAGKPAAVNPSNDLARIARRNDWPVLRWERKGFQQGKKITQNAKENRSTSAANDTEKRLIEELSRDAKTGTRGMKKIDRETIRAAGMRSSGASSCLEARPSAARGRDKEPGARLRGELAAAWPTCGMFECVALGYFGVSSTLIIFFAENLAHPARLMGCRYSWRCDFDFVQSGGASRRKKLAGTENLFQHGFGIFGGIGIRTCIFCFALKSSGGWCIWCSRVGRTRN